MICLVSMSAGVSCRAVQRVCGGSASSRVEVRAAPGETAAGTGERKSGHVASTRESKQLETQLGNTYSYLVHVWVWV